MNKDIQDTYEKIVLLTHTDDLCYRKCMLQYKDYIEKNFAVQTILELDCIQATRPLTEKDIKSIAISK